MFVSILFCIDFFSFTYLGSLTVIAAKAVSSMLSLTFRGYNQLIYPIFYIMLVIMIVTAVGQIKWVLLVMTWNEFFPLLSVCVCVLAWVVRVCMHEKRVCTWLFMTWNAFFSLLSMLWVVYLVELMFHNFRFIRNTNIRFTHIYIYIYVPYSIHIEFVYLVRKFTDMLFYENYVTCFCMCSVFINVSFRMNLNLIMMACLS